MALGRAYSVAVCGIDGRIVEIEADHGGGLPSVHLVGLPDPALRESRDRVRSAIVNSAEKWPPSRLILALSPATLRKVGSAYDVALAAAVLCSRAAIPANSLDDIVLLGELALDGRLRSVRGVLPAVLAARKAGFRCVIVPEAGLAEAGLADGIHVLGAATLREVVNWLRGYGMLSPPRPRQHTFAPVRTEETTDLSDVLGQEEARWALEIAAAGAHHLMLTGPPGIGKTMLAQRLPSLLPPLDEAEALEVTAIHSLAGELVDDEPLVTKPPFVAPHHTATIAAMVGGGVGMAKPGAVSRAHRGVLFLDEYAEMSAAVLEALRTPLEDGEVRIARRDGVARYPARFQLILAANPCPCAPARDADCVCTPTARRRYLAKFSGPLMDRIDLCVRMRSRTPGAQYTEPGETSTTVRARVAEARKAAASRWREYGWRSNAEALGPLLRRHFPLPADVMAVVESATRQGAMSTRGVERAIRVAWTICDLRGGDAPSVGDVRSALTFRDRNA